mgnify:CR=1
MPAQTARQMLPAIGQSVTVRCESLHVACTVEDVKNSYGRNRLLVRPLSGSGQQWVELERVTVKPDYINTVDALLPLPAGRV